MSAALRIPEQFSGFTKAELNGIEAGDKKIYVISADGEMYHGEIGVIKDFINQQLGLEITNCIKKHDRYILDVELIDGGESIYEDGIEAVESVDISETYGI